MGKRTCITCDVKSVDKDKTPLWSKKNGLYSMLPRVLNCEDKYNPHKTELEETSPEIVGTELKVELKLKEKDNWVFYWAAEPGAAVDGDKVEGAAKSYGEESNHGLSKINSQGIAHLSLNCPKLYKEDDTLFPRHVHYTVLTKDNVWSTNIGTMEVMCKLDFETMDAIQDKKTYVILNALSKESFDENHIPNSLLCHHESLDGIKKQPKTGIIKKLITENLSNYPPIKQFIKNKGEIKEIPIVVYCASEECNASSKLIEHLYTSGFYNILEYPGGMKEWLEKSNKIKTKLFDDAQTDEESVYEDDEGSEQELGSELEIEDVNLDDMGDDEEIIVYDGVEYIHKLDDSDEILLPEDLTFVGIYDGEEIEWINPTEYENHVLRKDGKGAIKKKKDDHDEDDEEAGEEQDESEAEEQDESEEEAGDEANDEADDEEDPEVLELEESSDEDEDDEDDYQKLALMSKSFNDLHAILSKIEGTLKGIIKTKGNSKKKDMVNYLMKKKTNHTGGGYSDNIIYGGRVDREMYRNSFRGWGFTFNM